MHRSDWLLGEVEGRRGRERLDKLDCRGCEPSLRVDRELSYEAVVRAVVLRDEVVKVDILAGMQVVVEVVVLKTFGCHSPPLATALVVDFTAISWALAA